MKLNQIQRMAIALAALVLTFNLKSGAAPGEVDLSFHTGFGMNGTVTAMAVQPDGKLVVGGYFTTVRGLVRQGIARLNADGSGDSSFDPGTGANGGVRAIALQPDGRVLIGGYFTTINGVSRNGIARLNADGSLDPTFNPGTGVSGQYSPEVETTALQPDGRVLLGGGFHSVNGILRQHVARLNADGTLDTSFNPGAGPDAPVYSVAPQPNGRMLIAGSFHSVNGLSFHASIVRLNANGSVDTSYRDNQLYGTIYSVAVQADGKVVVGGLFYDEFGTSGVVDIARLNADGSLDTGFRAGLDGGGWVKTVASQPDGKVLIGGQFTSVNGASRNNLARLNADGSLDTTFDPGAGDTGEYPWEVETVVLQADGKVLSGGRFELASANGPSRHAIARLNANGSLDATFIPNAGVDGPVVSLALQPDGNAIIGGVFRSVNSTSRHGIARLNADGTLDTTFEPGAGAGGDFFSIISLALQPDGKVLIGGAFTSVNGVSRTNLARLNPDGSLDAGFRADTEQNGYVHALALQPDGKVLIGGFLSSVNGVSRKNVARLNADGSLDPFFDPDITFALGGPRVQAIAVQPDGRVIVGGTFSVGGSESATNIVRFNADGSVDTSFNAQSEPGGYISAVVPQPDGKLLIGGVFTRVNDISRTNIARLNADGTLDATFNAGRRISGFNTVRVALQPDGKVLVGGNFSLLGGMSQTNLVRLNSDGSLDTRFNSDTAGGTLYAMALEPEGGVVVGGTFTFVNGVACPMVARLFGDAPPRITVQPHSHYVTVGENVTFTAAATGTSPLSYQWRKDGINLSSATSSSLTLTAVQVSDQGLYSVAVSNAFGGVISSDATLRVDRLPLADASATATPVLSANGVNATVLLDGSRSSDPDGDPLQYAWYEAATPLAAGVTAVTVLSVGTHSILLIVSDGLASTSTSITVEVITTAQAVEHLVDLVNEKALRPQPLNATLSAALASIQRGNTTAAINQLQAFQNKVRAQVAPGNAALAQALAGEAQRIVNLLKQAQLETHVNKEGRQP